MRSKKKSISAKQRHINAMRTLSELPKNDAKTMQRSTKYACPPVLCNCPIQLLATDNTHTMLPSMKVMDKFGVEEEFDKMSCCCE
jgi:hypothetical protein